MADEIRVVTGIGVENGSLTLATVSRTRTYDQANPVAPAPGGVTVGTTEELLDFGDVTPGWTEFTNLDDTNYVEFGFATTDYGFVLPPGASCVLKLISTASVFAKADTASCQLYIKGIED